jgi:hypothetical protein
MNEVDIPLKITGIGAMKAELRELKGAIADATDPAAIVALSQRAGELKDRIGDANEAVNVFATGSKFEQVSNGIGGIKDSLMSLDFEEASDKAKNFAASLGKLNPADIGKSMKGLVSTITTVGGAFVKLGMTILANPLFLLIAVITAIVVAIGFFLKKIGVLDAIFKAIMIPINAVIQGFKDLTDWMGLTDNAAEENAEAVKEASAKNIKNIQDQGKAREDLYNLTKDMSNAEIEALEKQLGIEINQNESIYDIKQQTMEQTYAQNQAEMDALQLKDELSEEDIKRMDELYNAQVQLNRDMLANDIARIQAKQKLEADLDKQIELLQVKQIKGESERAKAMLDIQKKEALSKVEQQIKDAELTGDTALLAKALKLKGLIIDDFKRQELEITNKGNAGIAKSNISASTKSAKETKSAESKKLEEMRKAGESALLLLQTNRASEEDIEKEKLKQLDAELTYVKANKAKLYKATVDQDIAINKLQKSINDINDKEKAAKEKEDNADALVRLERAVLNAETEGKSVLLAQKDLLTEQSRQKMLLLEVGSDEALLLADQTAKGLADIDKQIVISDKEKNLKILAAAQLVAETKQSAAAFDLERFKGTSDQQIAKQEEFLATTLKTLDTQRIAELAALNLSEEEKEAIKEKYRQAEIVATEAKTAKIVDIEKKARDAQFAAITKGFEWAEKGQAAATQLADLVFSSKKKKLKEGTAEYEKAAKQEFKIMKSLQLSAAIIDAGKAITASLAASPVAIGPIPNPAGIASLAFAALTSAMNIAKIAGTQFTSTTPPSDPGNPGLGGDTSTGGMATPSASLFGSNNNFNNVGAPGGQGGGNNITVTAIVSETEMTSTQDRVNRIKRNAEL